MKLTELIRFLVNPGQIKELYQNLGINDESEALLIYLEGSLKVDTNIAIFGVEETDDDLIFEKNGTRYIQLFPIDHAIDLIESDLNLKNRGYSDLEIAQRLIEYRENDA